jgi:hypothetical protein
MPQMRPQALTLVGIQYLVYTIVQFLKESPHAGSPLFDGFFPSGLPVTGTGALARRRLQQHIHVPRLAIGHSDQVQRLAKSPDEFGGVIVLSAHPIPHYRLLCLSSLFTTFHRLRYCRRRAIAGH